MAKFSVKIEFEIDMPAKELREELNLEPDDDLEEAIQGAFEDIESPLDATLTSVAVQKK